MENPTQMMAVAFSPNGQRLAARAIVDAVTIWDGATHKMVFSVPGTSLPDSGVAFSPDGERLASVGARIGEERMVFVWNARSGQVLLTLRGGTRCVSFSPDGRRLLGGIDNTQVAVWDSTTGQLLLTLRGHSGPVYSVAVSPDGTRIASGSEDGTVRVWDATPLEEPRGPSAPGDR
jgi:WD40 repeat protein